MSATGSPFGVRLHSRAVVPPRAGTSRPAVVIGTIHGGEFQIVEFEDDATTAAIDASTGVVHPLNRDRTCLECFVDALAAHLRSGMDDPGPTVMTADQATERLAALRAGRITPRIEPVPAVPDRERAAELRRRLNRIDPAALLPGGWWHVTLEQIDDGIL
ncbi:SUKH-4 family immunity protein [Rhodococcus triatomae]